MKNTNTYQFTQANIEEMATNSSFEKGKDIFLSNDVQNITKTGNRYDAIVYGTRKYQVYLIDDADELHLDCNCPHNFEGICKHLVAFALKILDGDFIETVQNRTPQRSENEFKSMYSKIATTKKLLFLKQLLDRDTDLSSKDASDYVY